jgi:hypothetical protein
MRDEGERLDGRVIAPMQVLQHDDHRRRVARAVEQLAQFPQHAILRGGADLLAQDSPILRVQQPGHLEQPGGCHERQAFTDGGPHRRATQRVQRLQERHVRLRRPVMLHALAAAHHRRLRQGGEEAVHQGRLADAGVSPDEHQLA